MKLNRANLAKMNHVDFPRATQKIVHIGLGAFHRAHQAWYTAKSDQDQQWGIVAFTGRSPDAAIELSEQDGLFTLITRGSNGDSFEVIDSIIRAEDGNNEAAFTEAVCNPETAIISLTITEAGYGMTAEGHVDLRNPPPALMRLAKALESRRRANGLGLAIISCDNMPGNGDLLRVAMGDLFSELGTESNEWLSKKVSFVSTSIDRITPKTTHEDTELVKTATGWSDASPVVTEPFSDWVLQGEFPMGRPNWEIAGAKFVDNLEPFENRKLWLLNGAHSLLAYLGQSLGHKTVAEAIADEVCRDAVENYWNEAEIHLDHDGLNIPEYRSALLDRFHNPRIAHQLSQIAIDGSTKLRVRIAAVAKAELVAGRTARASAVVIAAWVSYLLASNEISDSRSQQIKEIKDSDSENLVKDLVSLIDADLAANSHFMKVVAEQTELQKI